MGNLQSFVLLRLREVDWILYFLLFQIAICVLLLSRNWLTFGLDTSGAIISRHKSRIVKITFATLTQISATIEAARCFISLAHHHDYRCFPFTSYRIPQSNISWNLASNRTIGECTSYRRWCLCAPGMLMQGWLTVEDYAKITQSEGGGGGGRERGG